MQERFQFALSKDEYVAGLATLTDQLGRQDTSRTSRLIEQLAVFVGVSVIIITVFPEAVTGVLVAAVLLAVATAMLQRRWLRGATGQSYDAAVAEQEVLITDEGISTNSELRRRQWSWRAVRRIYDLKRAIVLEVVGWDMIILPDRLWESGEERSALLEAIRGLATAADPPATPRLASIGTRDLLRLGAIGAAVDVFALVSFALPSLKGLTPTTSGAAFLGMFAVLQLLGGILAYFAFRASGRGLERLYDVSPVAAIGLTQMLIWAVPVYMLIAYFRGI